MTAHTRRRAAPMRRLALWTTILSLASVVTAGCGRPADLVDVTKEARAACDAPAPTQPTVINVLAYSGPALDPFTDALVDGCSHVKNIQVKRQPVDFAGQLQKGELSLSADTSSYELIEAYNGSVARYASKGWLRPLDGYIKKYKAKYHLADIDSKAWDGFRYRGKIYGLPNQTNAQILIYRKDLFAKLGLSVPRTSADMVAAARKLKQDGSVKYPLAMVWGSDDALADGFHGALTSRGGRWFDTRGKPAFQSAQGVRAIEDMKAMLPYMPAGTLTYGNGDVMALMQQGLVGMTTIWASRAGSILDSNQSRVADKVGFATAPAATRDGPPAGETSQDGFVIPRNSRVAPDLLFRLTASTTLASPVMKKASVAAIPSRASLLTGKSTERSYWKAVRRTGEDGAVQLPPVPWMDPLTKTVVNPYLARALKGKSSAQEALRLASRELTSTLRAKGYLR
ncbi:ABC transporter substrate-binding protein [Streptomyces sp. NPDC001661]